jgi:hypothetical protein
LAEGCWLGLEDSIWLRVANGILLGLVEMVGKVDTLLGMKVLGEG